MILQPNLYCVDNYGPRESKLLSISDFDQIGMSDFPVDCEEHHTSLSVHSLLLYEWTIAQQIRVFREEKYVYSCGKSTMNNLRSYRTV